MTISIVVPGATFTKFSRITKLPFIDDVTGYFLLGGSAAESLKNRAIGATGAPALVGAPSFDSAGYGTLSYSNGIDVGFKHGRPYTHLVIARRGTGDNGLIGAWTPGGNPSGSLNLLFVQGGLLTHAVDGTSRGGSFSVAALAGFHLFAATYDGATSRVYAHNGTSLLSGFGPYVSSAPQPTTNPRIGASTYGAGNFDVAAAVLNDRAMSAEEITELYNYLKPYLATRGVTVA